MLLLALACAAALAAQQPSALWRFEDAPSLGKDSAQAQAHPLSITGAGAMLATRALELSVCPPDLLPSSCCLCSARSPAALVTAGPWHAAEGTADEIVGGYLQADGFNVTLSVSAATAGALPATPVPGLTVELLFRLPRIGNFNKAANTTLIRGGSGGGDDGWAVVFDRHSLRFRAAGRSVAASLVGSGVRSVWNLVDGNWHHLACRIDAKTGEQSICGSHLAVPFPMERRVP